MNKPLSNSEKVRYARHLTLPQVGIKGQERLKNSSILVVGAGGLGSPSLLYLAAAGIYAINHQLKDLKEDHRKAKELGDVLQMRDFVKNIEPVATNILIFSLIENISESEFIKDLNKNGIDIISLGKGKLRMVTHRDYTQNHHDYVLTTLIKMNGYA